MWKIEPIVGEINGMKCKILFELTNINDTLDCEIFISDSNDEELVSITQNIKSEEKGFSDIIINFSEYGKYKLIWYININGDKLNKIYGYEHEIVIKERPDKMIVVSCDMLEANVENNKSMWKIMEKELQNNDQIITMHLGDQAYMDGVFNKCLKLVKTGKYDEEFFINEFGQRYYDTWKNHIKILSNTMNINIWDDHEIKNNMLLNDESISDDEKTVRGFAVEAYKKYQESFHLDKQIILTKYSWYKIIGDVLLIAFERTSENLNVQKAINIIKELSECCEHLVKIVICFSGAPIPPPSGPYGTLYEKLVGDMDKFWKTEDMINLYNNLFEIVEKGKDVVVCGGDLHFGTYGIMEKRGLTTLKIPVMISSPITNQPTIDRWLASKGLKGNHKITDQIIFKTIKTKARRCYGVINFNDTPMSLHMEFSDQKMPKNIIKYLRTLISFA